MLRLVLVIHADKYLHTKTSLKDQLTATLNNFTLKNLRKR